MPERTCAQCGTSLPWTPRRKYCDPCALDVKRRQARQAYRNGRRKIGAALAGDEVMTECKYCGTSFTHVFRSIRRTSCDDCARRLSGQARDRWAKNNPDRIAAIKQRYRQGKTGRANESERSQRFRRYGVTAEWYEQQLASQAGRCANRGCRAPSPGGRHNAWHIDHDHLTGQVRGLLCNGCNIAAGHAQDDPDVLKGLSDYIRQHRQLRLAV